MKKNCSQLVHQCKKVLCTVEKSCPATGRSFSTPHKSFSCQNYPSCQPNNFSSSQANPSAPEKNLCVLVIHSSVPPQNPLAPKPVLEPPKIRQHPTKILLLPRKYLSFLEKLFSTQQKFFGIPGKYLSC